MATIFAETHEWVKTNPYAKVRKNISTGYGGDAMTVK